MLFVCDMQTAFQKPIHQFPSILSTTQKLLRASEILSIPVFATTQSKSKLGPNVPDLSLTTHPNVRGDWDKTKFSMWIPEVKAAVEKEVGGWGNRGSIAIVGIESHVCVLQTVLDLLKEEVWDVYVIADGVSSCNKEEVGIALQRMRESGAVVTTSESWIYEVMGDAGIERFREVAKVVKETSGRSKEVFAEFVVEGGGRVEGEMECNTRE